MVYEPDAIVAMANGLITLFGPTETVSTHEHSQSNQASGNQTYDNEHEYADAIPHPCFLGDVARSPMTY